jgi:hypothetical protein
MVKLTAFEIWLVYHILDENGLLVRIFKLRFSDHSVVAVAQTFDAGGLERRDGAAGGASCSS